MVVPTPGYLDALVFTRHNALVLQLHTLANRDGGLLFDGVVQPFFFIGLIL